jgi:hypothetical protein
MAVDVHISNSTVIPNPFLALKIPKKLLHGISEPYSNSATNNNLSDDQEKKHQHQQKISNVHYTIDNSDLNYTEINMEFPFVDNARISIVGK